ncbi:MAG: Lrp/AsnC ligand binding domain-containing protein, partial [Actinomycetota bacterium]
RLGPGAYARDPDFADPVFDGVIDAMHLTGRFDVQLHVMTRDVTELDRLLEKLKDEMGAEETNTRLVLRQLEGFPRAVRPG